MTHFSYTHKEFNNACERAVADIRATGKPVTAWLKILMIKASALGIAVNEKDLESQLIKSTV